ncbi:MAG: hypothetical protein HY765_05155 [Rhodomicrobium sp.]|nr:hypothetical protein [Rhodomicrobium sp.]
MRKLSKALATAGVALAIASPAAFAAGPSATIADGAGKAGALKNTLRHDVQVVYVRRSPAYVRRVVRPRQVIVRRVYVPYWAGAAPSYYYGAYAAYPAYTAYPSYTAYPAYSANVYVAPQVVAAPTVVAAAPLVATPPVVAAAPVVATWPAVPFLPF